MTWINAKLMHLLARVGHEHVYIHVQMMASQWMQCSAVFIYSCVIMNSMCPGSCRFLHIRVLVTLQYVCHNMELIDLNRIIRPQLSSLLTGLGEDSTVYPIAAIARRFSLCFSEDGSHDHLSHAGRYIFAQHCFSVLSSSDENPGTQQIQRFSLKFDLQSAENNLIFHHLKPLFFCLQQRCL